MVCLTYCICVKQLLAFHILKCITYLQCKYRQNNSLNNIKLILFGKFKHQIKSNKMYLVLN